MKIISRPEKNYSGSVLNRYLEANTSAKKHGFSEIGHYYAEFGWNYGVNYLWAFAQMLHETNYLRFGGDVIPEQNNFAGLATTGGGVKGDFYSNSIEGVKAHILHLAAYAGIDYRKELVKQADGSPSRTEDVFQWIYGTAQTFRGLTMKWATDDSYYKKIEGIYQKLISWCEENAGSEIVLGTGPGYQVRYAFLNKGMVEFVANSSDFRVMYSNLKDENFMRPAYRNEAYFEQYKIPTPVINEVEKGSEVASQSLAGKTIVLDPGHSEKYPGASGLPPDRPEEEDLNRMQASIIASRLKSLGAKVVVYDPLEDSLWGIGQKARGADMFLSLHHNAYDADGQDEYTCVMVQRTEHRSADVRFAELCSRRIAKAIGNPNFRGKMPEYPEGVYPANLGVLRSAINTGCPVCVLTESYFIDDYGSWEVAEERSRKAAEAIAQSVIDWFAK